MYLHCVTLVSRNEKKIFDKIPPSPLNPGEGVPDVASVIKKERMQNR